MEIYKGAECLDALFLAARPEYQWFVRPPDWREKSVGENALEQNADLQDFPRPQRRHRFLSMVHTPLKNGLCLSQATFKKSGFQCFGIGLWCVRTFLQEQHVKEISVVLMPRGDP
jgi:hypothetical protein